MMHLLVRLDRGVNRVCIINNGARSVQTTLMSVPLRRRRCMVSSSNRRSERFAGLPTHYDAHIS
jgi:hypothetical protein